MSASKNLIQAAAGVGGDFYPYTVDYSARFERTSADYLSRTIGTSGNRKTWTLSYWYKPTDLNNWQYQFSKGTSTDFTYIAHTVSTTTYGMRLLQNVGNITQVQMQPTMLLRDSSAWYHIVWAIDTTQATTANRVRLYVNGVEVTSWQTATYPSQNYDFYWGQSSTTHYIGNHLSNYTSGYFSQITMVFGSQLAPSSFGEDKNGIWVPKDVSGLTFGAEGFLLDFSNSAALGTDVSGNGNNWTPSGLTSSDQMIDTPTNNFATMNPLESGLGCSDGNLVQNSGASAWRINKSTVYFNVEEDWYFEARLSGSGSDKGMIGISVNEHSITTYFGNGGEGYGYNMTTGGKYSEGAGNVAYGSTAVSGDIIGVHISGGSLTFYKNGVSQGVAYSGLTGYMTPSFAQYLGYTWTANFGQNGTFNGAITAGGNTDANGLGDFKYTVPTGALALCTANLPEPAIGPNSTTTSGENFNTVIFTGDGANPRSITGVGFQPDLVWFKRRSSSGSHWLVDAVRGVSSTSSPSLSTDSSSSGAEADIYNPNGGVISFDTDGFTSKGSVGNTNINTSGITAVTWNWKGNGSGVSNTDGTITTTVSANQAAGFSILKYTGNATVNATLGHGLNAVPKCALFKAKDQTYASGYDWYVYHVSLGQNQKLKLNTNGAASASSNEWPTAATSSVFYVGSGGGTNGSGLVYIAYLFAEVEGFSKFGSYTGNGSADGPYIYTGFRPAWVMIKATSGIENWVIYDTARDTYNELDSVLYSNLSNSEFSGTTVNTDALSNGFKPRDTWTSINGSGTTYIYMAFAEAPFKYANAR